MVFYTSTLISSCSMTKKTPLERRIEAVTEVVRKCQNTFIRRATQPGRHDLFLSVFVTGILFAPLWASTVAAQVGTSEAQDVLCSTSGINVAQIITIGLGLISAYFILKFLIRMMTGLDKAGSTDSGAQQQGKKQAKGGIYSLVAALLPVIVPAALNVANIDVVSCLLP
jgi:hypothetical protein